MSNSTEWWIEVKPTRLAFGRRGWSAIGMSSDGRIVGQVLRTELGSYPIPFRGRNKHRVVAKARAALVKYHTEAARELEDEAKVSIYRWSPEDEAL